MIGKILKWLISLATVIALTTLTIDATDHMDNFSQSIVGAALGSVLSTAPCPDGMSEVISAQGNFCIDTYEVSAGDECPYESPRNQSETDANIAVEECMPMSAEGVQPWTYVSRHQAQYLCAKADKRLPTYSQWHEAALGTPDKTRDWSEDDCQLDNSKDQVRDAGDGSLCVSFAGAYDMIGNVWEWVDETVEDGKLGGVELPKQGYITEMNDEGIVLKTSPQPDPSHFNDYLWVETSETRGVIRGGFWGVAQKGGQYAANVTVPPSFAGNGVGFRCVQ